MFNALRESRGAARDYHLRRRDAHLIKERNSQKSEELRRRIALLEAKLSSVSSEKQIRVCQGLCTSNLCIGCDKMTYAECLRMASRSEPFILMTGAPMPSSPEDGSNKVPGVPRWSPGSFLRHARGVFSLKVVEDDHQAQRMWARMKVLKSYHGCIFRRYGGKRR